jgi:carboxymethylenebutenolidase
MRAALLVTLIALFAISCLAAEGKQVSYRSGDETVNAMLYTPSGKGPFPALVVVHEWWGLNDWVKEQASKLADKGYLTLAIDIYRGKVASDPEEAHELMRGVPEDRAKRDLAAAFNYLKSRRDVNAKGIGVIGWCMGGGYAMDMALLEPGLAAAVINYGHLATEPAELKKINAPILGIFGGQDRGIPVEDVRKFEQQMKQFGKKIDVVIYPDAGHAFENPNNKGGYREKDAASAWETTVKFLDTHLKKGIGRAKRPAAHEDDDEDIELDDRRVPIRTTWIVPQEAEIG